MGDKFLALLRTRVTMIALGFVLSADPVLGQNRSGNVRRTVLAAPVKKPSFSQNSSFYQSARKYYQAGNYAKAIQFAAADLRRDPGHQASTILMGQSYYRLGNVRRAAKLFSQFEPADVPQEAAVEYLLAMFGTRRFKAAIKAFPRISEADPYRDIASYYVGLSYMNLRLWSRAELYLRRARNIPQNMRAGRRQLLSDLDKIIEQERGGAIFQSSAYAYEAPPPTPTPVAPPPMVGPATGPAKPEKAQPPPGPSAGFSFAAIPEFDYTMKDTRLDLNGYQSQEKTENTPLLKVPMTLKYFGKNRPAGQPWISFAATPTYSDTDSQTTTSKQVASFDDPTNVLSNSTKSNDHGFFTDALFAVDSLYPVSDPIDVGVGFIYDMKWVDANAKKEQLLLGPTAKIGAEVGGVKLDLGANQIAKTDRTQDPSKINTVTTITGGLKHNGDNSVSKLGVSSVQTDATSGVGEKAALNVDLSWKKTLGD